MRPTDLLAPLALSLALLGCPAEQGEVAKGDGGGGGREPSEAPAKPQTPAPRPAYVPPPLLEVPPPTVDSPAIIERGEVVATLQLPGGSSLGDLAPLLDGFKPGTAALARLQLPTLLKELSGVDLAGADLSAPIAAIVVNPQGRTKPLALLVAVNDLDALRKAASEAGHELREREGFALLGPADVVAAAEAYAFTHLRTQPAHTEIVVYPKLLLEPMLAQLQTTFAQLGTMGLGNPASFESFGKIYVDMLRALAEQSDRVVLSVSVGTTGSDIYMRVYPQPNTNFASFVSAQVPADHALLAKLPAGPAGAFVMSGTLHAGGAKDAMIAMAESLMQIFYPLEPNTWARLMGSMLETFDGSFAAKIAMQMPIVPDPPLGASPIMSMQVLYGSSDADASRRIWREVFGLIGGTERPPLELAGMKMSVDFQADALAHEGVAIDSYATKLDLSGISPEGQAMMAQANATQPIYFAAFDRVIGMASSPEATTALIDAARGKGQTFVPNETLARALAASTARGDSFAYFLDLASMLPPNLPEAPPISAMVMSLGKQGEALSLCVSLQK